MSEKVKKATFQEAIRFMLPVFRELNRVAIPHEVNEKTGELTVKIPKFIPIRKV